MGLTVSRLANVAARGIYDAFREYRRKFSTVTRRARKRFEEGNVGGLSKDTRRRIELYDQVVAKAVAGVKETLEERIEEHAVWMGMKAVFSGLVTGRGDWDLAETFYNSVTRRIFTTVGVNQDIEFADTDFDTPPNPPEDVVYRVYEGYSELGDLVSAILSERGLTREFRDLAGDSQRVAEVLERRLATEGALRTVGRAEIIDAVFFRVDGAYVIGRLFTGAVRIPVVFALGCSDEGLFVDAVLLDEDDISILFSFTRSYFHVETRRPYDLVHYLKLILPGKRIAELYISIGCNKHGKTELYRDLIRQLRTTPDRFELAPGKRGTVMIVFTLPSYDLVFKVIRDTFPTPKKVTREGVKQAYRRVFEHDRAGRLVDTQEFAYLELDRARFSDELLELLSDEATTAVGIGDDHVVLRHVYVQRRVTPLDLYIRAADEKAAEAATLDFGVAIKDLARADVFPGDLFLKNFGVTRHGRVVFYDYDELTRLTTCNFRKMPEPSSYEDAISAEPWFSVGDDDVFPEEFPAFLGLPASLRELLLDEHGDLFAPGFWRKTQERLKAGEVMRSVPYSPHRLVRSPSDGQLNLW